MASNYDLVLDFQHRDQEVELVRHVRVGPHDKVPGWQLRGLGEFARSTGI